MSFALKGVAYVTGAGSGIGQHIAYALAKQGVRLFALVDRNPLSKTISELQKISPGISVKKFELDVTDEQAVDDSIEKTAKEFGRLDYAVNDAGISGMIATSDKVPKHDFEKIIAVNTTAFWQCQRAQVRQMLKQDKESDLYRSYRGSIVNVASMYGVVAPPLDVPATAYATSKHAIIGLTKSNALAFAHQGIRNQCHFSRICFYGTGSENNR